MLCHWIWLNKCLVIVSILAKWIYSYTPPCLPLQQSMRCQLMLSSVEHCSAPLLGGICEIISQSLDFSQFVPHPVQGSRALCYPVFLFHTFTPSFPFPLFSFPFLSVYECPTSPFISFSLPTSTSLLSPSLNCLFPRSRSFLSLKKAACVHTRAVKFTLFSYNSLTWLWRPKQDR